MHPSVHPSTIYLLLSLHIVFVCMRVCVLPLHIVFACTCVKDSRRVMS